MIQMRRYRIHPTPEIHIMREIYFVATFKTLSHRQPKQKFTPQWMRFIILLMLLKKLELFSEWCLSYHLWLNGTIIESLGHFAKSTANRPDILNDIKQLFIDFPFHLAKFVHDITDRRQVNSLHILHGLPELRMNFGQLGLLEIKATKEIILPRSRPVNHRKRTLELQIQIMDLVQFTDELFNEAFVKCQIPLILFISLPDCLGFQQ